MATQPTTTNTHDGEPQSLPQDDNPNITTPTTTTTDFAALKSQLASQTETIASLEARLRTQTALGELYFEWGQDSDALLKQATRLLKAKDRQVRRFKGELLKGHLERAKLKVVTEVLVKLCEDEVLDLEGEGDVGGGEDGHGGSNDQTGTTWS